MARIVLFEDHRFSQFLPLVYWRTVFELRLGRKTLMDRAAHYLGQPVAGLWTRDWLAAVAAERCQIPINPEASADTLLINGRWLFKAAPDFRPGPFIGTSHGAIAYVACDESLAGRVHPADFLEEGRTAALLERVPHDEVDAFLAQHPWELIAKNVEALEDDWLTSGRAIEGTVSNSAVMIDVDNISVGQGSQVKPLAVIDAGGGPVYISNYVTVESHAVIEGPAYIGPGSVVRSHAHIHGGASIGPVCKVGGEIDATIITGYSNKQHTGFLGHAYLGSWINLGAGVSNSDLKNTYGTVRTHVAGRDIETGQMFVGAVIGDHAKIGINQSIPTGGVIGFSANVFVSGVMPKSVPSFAWFTDKGRADGDPARLLEIARRVMARRNVTLYADTEKLFFTIAELAQRFESPST